MVHTFFDGIAQRYVDADSLTAIVIITAKIYRLPELKELVSHMIPEAYHMYLTDDKGGDQDSATLQYPLKMLSTVLSGQRCRPTS